MPAGSKTVGKAVIALVKVPKVGNPPDYRGWLRAVESKKENRRALMSMTKEEVDSKFHELLQAHFKHDDISVDRYMAQTTTKAGILRWERLEGNVGRKVQEIPLKATFSDEVKNLKLPPLMAHPDKSHKRGQNEREMFSKQTYEDFASQAERINPDVEFGKDLMDEAFRLAVSKLGFGGIQVSVKEAMITRCLGRESNKYWAKR